MSTLTITVLPTKKSDLNDAVLDRNYFRSFHEREMAIERGFAVGAYRSMRTEGLEYLQYGSPAHLHHFEKSIEYYGRMKKLYSQVVIEARLLRKHGNGTVVPLP